tara:strand:+ start:279 stop:626 length:348 start_codon:yes stop_codon:yes gene_type:complete
MFIPSAEKYLEYYTKDYGERDLNKILHAVSNDKRFNNLIAFSLQNKVLPTPNDFIECVMNKITWSFAKKTKIIAAAIILLLRWDAEVNQKYGLASSSTLEGFTLSIIESGNQMGM